MLPLVCRCSFLFAGALTAAQSQPAIEPAPTTEPATATQMTVGLSPADYPEGVSDEASLEAHNRARTIDILAAADREDEPLVQAEHRLAAANWILARRTEPQVSRLLLGIESPTDLASLRSSVADARVQLEACRRLLDDPADDDESHATGVQEPQSGPAGAQSREGLRGLHDDLSALAQALAVVWSPDGGDDYGRQVRRCASALGVLLEDERPGVAAAAAMYQALLYRRADRPDRALAVLDLATRPLPRGGEAWAFFSRLLRCRFLAQQGSHALAWSLLLKLEERAHEWFEATGQGEQAARTALLVRHEVAGAWQQQLAQAGLAAEAAWCQRAAEQIRQAMRESRQPPTVMRIRSAIPFLLEDYDYHTKEPAVEPG